MKDSVFIGLVSDWSIETRGAVSAAWTVVVCDESREVFSWVEVRRAANSSLSWDEARTWRVKNWQTSKQDNVFSRKIREVLWLYRRTSAI